jgi:hypothetical protein
MRIDVHSIVGKNAITLKDGNSLYAVLSAALVDGAVVELDFTNVEVFATPFFNAGVGQLLAHFDPKQLNNLLHISHLSKLGDSVLRRVIRNAKHYYELDDAGRAAIDDLIEHAGAE